MPSTLYCWVLISLVAADRPDVIINDFEAETYGAWKTQGTAFGNSPARGTLPGQMEVTGFQGKGLVNSFLGGDDPKGTLTSPPFTIERNHLNFLIGGGGYPGETCINLLVNDYVARTATGPNRNAGGSERLEWASWDVSNLVGKTAVLQVVDNRAGGWGHINVDQIVQSDRPRGVAPKSRELTVSRRYLMLPVDNNAEVRRLTIRQGETILRDLDIKLADGHASFTVPVDLANAQGKKVEVSTRLPAGSKALEALAFSDKLENDLAIEARRPVYHFTSRRGWLNDPNGLVYFDGEYHLFYQHNPYGWDWGNMHWGHAVSADLVHWQELGDALIPREYGDMAFSGSAVVDDKNSSGFGKGGKPPLVLAYTSTGRGECIAYSNDRGRTWSEYERNPVIKHSGRDPRLLWHAPSKQWVMAVYDEGPKRQSIDFHTSPDLKTWTFRSRIDGFFECPDLFELPVEGQAGRSYWVLTAADGEYMLGSFDGARFTPAPGYEKKRRLWYGNYYAAQTYSNTPDGRRIQVGWASGVTFPGLPFNQQMNVPVELTLRETKDGVRMFGEPVAELKRARTGGFERSDLTLKPGLNVIDGVTGDAFSVEAEAEVPVNGSITLNARGVPVVYDAAKKTITCLDVSAPLSLEDGKLRLQMLVDRGSVEVIANGGLVILSKGVAFKGGVRPLEIIATEGVKVGRLSVDEFGKGK